MLMLISCAWLFVNSVTFVFLLFVYRVGVCSLSAMDCCRFGFGYLGRRVVGLVLVVIAAL